MASCILSTNKAPLWPLIAATMVLSRAEGDVHFVSKPHIPNPGEFNNEGKRTIIEVEWKGKGVMLNLRLVLVEVEYEGKGVAIDGSA